LESKAKLAPLAVVTGASSGLGEVFARQLRQRGYRLILLARRAERLQALAAELGQCEVFVADLSLREEQERAAEMIRAREPDLLVNNAGFGSRGLFWEAPVESALTMHEVHLMAVMRLTHAALPVMVRRNSGGIINIASVAGFARSAGNVSYCATKGWMNDFTEGLALELRRAAPAVKVQALCPGLTYTEFHDRIHVNRRSFPASLWMKADFVVEASLRGFDAGKVFVIPGWRYRLFTVLVSLMPATWRMHFEASKAYKRN
jgi:uncharacterized protein